MSRTQLYSICIIDFEVRNLPYILLKKILGGVSVQILII